MEYFIKVGTKEMTLYNPRIYYQILSKYLDRLYRDQAPYSKAFKFIDDLRAKEELPKRIADVACGTGLFLESFKKVGYDIIGSDLSKDMLDQAVIRLPGELLIQASYHEVTFPNSVPLIVSFFNSFAYCQDLQTLSKVLVHLKSQLLPGGLIIFDLAVTDAPEEFFTVKSFTFDDGTQLSRTFLGYPEGRTFHSHFVFVVFENHKLQIHAAESTRGIFSEQDVLQAIDTAGLKLYPVDSGYSDLSNTATFVAQRSR